MASFVLNAASLPTRVPLCRSALRFAVFSLSCESNLRKARRLESLFSISSALFCAFAHFTFIRKPFRFYGLRTFSDNYRGWGYVSYVSLRHARLLETCTHPHKTVYPKLLFSISYERTRMLLKTSIFKSLHFQAVAHSLSLFSCKSFACLTYAKQRGGIPRKVSDSGILDYFLAGQPLGTEARSSVQGRAELLRGGALRYVFLHVNSERALEALGDRAGRGGESSSGDFADAYQAAIGRGDEDFVGGEKIVGTQRGFNHRDAMLGADLEQKAARDAFEATGGERRREHFSVRGRRRYSPRCIRRLRRARSTARLR